jgi:hypothetical protein
VHAVRRDSDDAEIRTRIELRARGIAEQRLAVSDEDAHRTVQRGSPLDRRNRSVTLRIALYEDTTNSS